MMRTVSRPFSAEVRSRPEATIIDLRGEINGSADEGLEASYTQAEQAGRDLILLNFSDVDYINSTGIALIVGLLARARKKRQRLATCGLSEHYQEIFRITRLSDFMDMYEDEASALEEGAG